MNKRSVIFIINWLAFLSILLLPFSAGAAVTKAKAPVSSRAQKEEVLCRQIQDKIKNRQEIGKVVKTSIQMGYDACGAIKCAIKGGGDTKQIVEGAVEAGASKEVVSRCALDVCPCADVKEKSAALGACSAKAVPICGQIQDKMKNIQEVRKTVKASIQTGYDACGVMRCAVKGGGEVDQVIAGAVDAGSTKDFASRCIYEGCANDIAASLGNIDASGMCYLLPEDPEIIVSPLKDVTKGGTFLSPSGF